MFKIVDGKLTTEKVSINIAVMVKNEAPRIKRTLESFWGVDCWTVLDTGSEDNTVDIVKALAVRNNKRLVFDQVEFVNFAHNRNILLEMCKQSGCDWTILLDANDEVQCEHEIRHILKLHNKDKNIVAFNMNHFWENDMGIKHNSETRSKPCLIRTGGPFRWSYPIHECLELTDKTKIISDALLNTTARIYQDRSKDKSSMERIRNFDIPTLISWLEDHPKDVRMMRYMCQSYLITCNWEQLDKWATRLIKHTKVGQVSEDIYKGFMWKGRAQHMLGNKCMKYYILAHNYAKPLAGYCEPFYECAQLLLQVGEIYGAYTMLHRCVSLEKPAPNAYIGINPDVWDLSRYVSYIYCVFLANKKRLFELDPKGIEHAQKSLEVLKHNNMSIIDTNDDEPLVCNNCTMFGLAAGCVYDWKLLPERVKEQMMGVFKEKVFPIEV